MGMGMGMVDRKWEGNGNKRNSLVVLIIFLALYFSAGYRRRRRVYRWFASLPHSVCGSLENLRVCTL